MDQTYSEWLNLILRWMHVIAAIMWIGSSIFFNWLDSHLEKKEGIEGELWMVHGGGFYQVEKKLVAPHQIPKTLHWFKWEAGFTWITGILLLAVVYYLSGGIYLLDRNISDISEGKAIALCIGSLVVGWAIYDTLWNSKFAEKQKLLIFVCVLLLAAFAWFYIQFLSGRAAYLHVGALLGTIMVANVWMRIIPSQRNLVQSVKEGRTPNALIAKKAKQRSRHNNYMTYPVVFIMISNHFPATYTNHHAWLVLMLVMLFGAGVRHFLNTGDRPPGLMFAALGIVVTLGLIFFAMSI